MSHADNIVVRIRHFSIVLSKAEVTVRHMVTDGRLPQPDVTLDRCQLGWRLSTLQSWNPLIAERIARLLEHQSTPPSL